MHTCEDRACPDGFSDHLNGGFGNYVLHDVCPSHIEIIVKAAQSLGEMKFRKGWL